VAASPVGPDQIPGLVALVSRADQVHVETVGSLSVGGPPVSQDSLFRIASTTKPVTGTAIMALVGEGVVRLDDRVERWWPELADRRVLQTMDGPLDATVPAARPIGLGTSWLVDPARDLVVNVLTQRVWQSPQPPAVHGELQDAAYAAVS